MSSEYGSIKMRPEKKRFSSRINGSHDVDLLEGREVHRQRVAVVGLQRQVPRESPAYRRHIPDHAEAFKILNLIGDGTAASLREGYCRRDSGGGSIEESRNACNSAAISPDGDGTVRTEDL